LFFKGIFQEGAKIRKIFVTFLLIVLAIFNMAGCAPLILGAAVGGVSVYAVSKDMAQGDTDKPYDSLWNAAMMVSKIRGTIKQEDYARGSIEFNTESSRVCIKLIRLTRAANRLRISARRYHLPDIDLAQEILMKILEEAK